MNRAVVQHHRGRLALILAAVMLVFAGVAGALPTVTAWAHSSAAVASKSKPELSCKQNTRYITDDMGHTVKIVGTPKRVVALELSFVDAMASVHRTPVGIADDNKSSTVTNQVASLLKAYTSVGLRQSPNLEVISSLHPDLILADTTRHAKIYSQLAQIAPTFVLSSLNSSYAGILQQAAIIGRAINLCKAMSARLAEHARLMKEYAKEVPKAFRGKTELFGVDTGTAFYFHSGHMYTPGVLASLGIKPAIPGHPGDVTTEIQLEAIAQADPQLFFVAKYGTPALVDTWSTNPLYQAITAVRDHRVYVVNQNTWSRWRGIIGSEIIARQLIKDLQHRGGTH